MGVFQNNLLAGAAAAASAGGAGFYNFQIEQSVRFSRSESTQMTRTFGSNGNRKKFTISWWAKLTASAGFSDAQYYFLNTASHTSPYGGFIYCTNTAAGYGDSVLYFTTNPGDGASSRYAASNGNYRDTSGFGHIVLIVDTAQSSEGDRLQIYLNGSRLDVHNGGSLAQDTDSILNGNVIHRLGARQDSSSSHFFDGYVAEMHWVDGYAYDASYFGETKNGVWIPKDYYTTTGNYGNTGFYLKFENASDLGNDSSGNNNDWTVSNMGTDHQVIDSPTFGS